MLFCNKVGCDIHGMLVVENAPNDWGITIQLGRFSLLFYRCSDIKFDCDIYGACCVENAPMIGGLPTIQGARREESD